MLTSLLSLAHSLSHIPAGGSFNVSTLVIWNRAGATYQTQIANGQTLLLNAYRAVIGAADGRALTTAPIQTLTYSLYAPTGTVSWRRRHSISGARFL